MRKLGCKLAACVSAAALLVAALPFTALADGEKTPVLEVYVNAASDVVIGEKPVVSAEDDERFLSMDEFYEDQGYWPYSFQNKDGDYIEDTSELVAGEPYDMTVTLRLRDTENYMMNYTGTATMYQKALEHQEDYVVDAYLNGVAIRHATDYNVEFGKASYVLFPEVDKDDWNFELEQADGPIAGHNTIQITFPVTAVSPKQEETAPSFEPGKSTGAKTGDDFGWFW